MPMTRFDIQPIDTLLRKDISRGFDGNHRCMFGENLECHWVIVVIFSVLEEIQFDELLTRERGTGDWIARVLAL